MISNLYPCMQFLNMFQTIWVYSDTHFDDPDTKLMDPSWVDTEEHIARINRKVGKNDVLIHLGDVGDPSYMERIRGTKLLITGNHDCGAEKYRKYFHQVYTGPLIITNKILLSHEPVDADWAFNIHGHIHNKENCGGLGKLCVTSNVVGYEPLNLTKIITSGRLREIKDIHRITIDIASASK